MTLISKIFNPQAKVLHHLDRVLDFFSGKNADPITLEIDPSNACNHSCPFCISGHIHLSKFKGTELFNRTMMARDFLLRLVKDLSKTEIKAISFTGGGEPTLNPHLKEAIEYLKKNSQIEMGMFTNGTNLERFDLFETIVSSLKWIRISIDAGSKKTYDSLRLTNKTNNFDVVINNIKKLIKFKKKNSSNLTIGVGFVISRETVSEVEDFAKIFKNIDIDYCQFKPEIIQIERGQNKEEVNKQISPEFWAHEVISKLNKASLILGNKFECNSYKVEDLIKDPKKYGREYKECIGSQFQPCIGADGEFYVCTNHRGHKEFSYGSLHEKSFEEIWNDLDLRRKMMDKICSIQKFSKCTNLCKPHESNKILWEIKKNINKKDYISEIKKNSKNLDKSFKHKNFI
jgi:MoaA/NifB/PqqE/SkfB family radical SAM enzyme